MLRQGPSQAILSLEWDSLWALNRKVIDPIAPRHWAIVKEDMYAYFLLLSFLLKRHYRVPVIIKGGPHEPYFLTLPKHKKKSVSRYKEKLCTQAMYLLNKGMPVLSAKTKK